MRNPETEAQGGPTRLLCRGIFGYPMPIRRRIGITTLTLLNKT
jgi:hypothetical protein